MEQLLHGLNRNRNFTQRIIMMMRIGPVYHINEADPIYISSNNIAAAIAIIMLQLVPRAVIVNLSAIGCQNRSHFFHFSQ